MELFELYEFQRMMGVPCKCGIERRKTTTSLYGGYFYTRSREEGLARYHEVRELVDIHLSKETPVILKRYCTEYEIGPDGQGPSDVLPPLSAEEIEYENFILENFPRTGYGTPQPDFVTAHVMQEWIHYAYQYHKATGDESFREFTDGSDLFKPYVTYHDGERIPLGTMDECVDPISLGGNPQGKSLLSSPLDDVTGSSPPININLVKEE